MSKKLLFTISFALTTMLVKAQQIKVEYENKLTVLPELMQQFFTMQNVQHSRLTIKGNFNGKRAKIKKVICNKGSFIESELIPDYVHFVFADSIETLDFMAVPYGEDSLRITCFYPEHFNSIIFNDTVRIDKMKILLETYTYGDSPDIPILAYTSGIPIQDGTWFCGLRDSGVEARKWYEKYKIDDYIFYTIKLEEDTPPNDDMSIYVKVAKKDAYATHK